jgi:hypothetical protein
MKLIVHTAKWVASDRLLLDEDQRPSHALLARRQPAPMSGFTDLVRIGK